MKVELLVFIKPVARDPEGETIASELRRRGFEAVRGVRVGKVYRFEIEAGGCEEAERLVREIAEKLRFYNPVVHSIEVRCLGGGSG